MNNFPISFLSLTLFLLNSRNTHILILDYLFSPLPGFLASKLFISPVHAIFSSSLSIYFSRSKAKFYISIKTKKKIRKIFLKDSQCYSCFSFFLLTNFKKVIYIFCFLSFPSHRFLNLS